MPLREDLLVVDKRDLSETKTPPAEVKEELGATPLIGGPGGTKLADQLFAMRYARWPGGTNWPASYL